MEKDREHTLQLDNEMGFALYACAKELIRKYTPALERLGLTYTGYLTMLALWERDGARVSDLGKRLYLDSGTLTPLLKKLEKQGLLERTSAPCASISPRGGAACKRRRSRCSQRCKAPCRSRASRCGRS